MTGRVILTSSLRSRTDFSPSFLWMDGTTACDLRGLQHAGTAIAILTRPTLGNPFHPPTHRLLCNRLPGTRPFPRRRWRAYNAPSKLACFVFPQRVDSALPAICEGCSALALRSPLGDGETHGSKFRSDLRLERSKFAETSTMESCGFTIAEAELTIHLLPV